jgi:hypothetical protein
MMSQLVSRAFAAVFVARISKEDATILSRPDDDQRCRICHPPQTPGSLRAILASSSKPPNGVRYTRCVCTSSHLPWKKYVFNR